MLELWLISHYYCAHRYSWKGVPLLFSSSPSHQPPKESTLVCKECGALCVFELQLMPPLVYILQQYGRRIEKVATMSKDQYLPLPLEKVVEFGTVLVYSCSASCWEEASCTSSSLLTFREEIVVVQPDPDTVDKL